MHTCEKRCIGYRCYIVRSHTYNIGLVGWMVGWLAGWLVGWLVGWCERESQEESGEAPAIVGWTHGKNGHGMVNKENGCAQRGW